MINSKDSYEVNFFDPEQLRQRYFKICDNITLEMEGDKVVQIISTDPKDYIRYAHLIGKNIK